MMLGNFIVLILGILLYLYSGYCFYRMWNGKKTNSIQTLFCGFFIIASFCLFLFSLGQIYNALLKFYGYLNQFNI